MGEVNTALFLLALLPVAALVKPASEKLFLPFPVVLIITGFVCSEIATRLLDINTGIHWQNFPTIIFYLILPILIFQSALEMDLKLLRQNLVIILMLAIPLMLVSTALIAAGLYFGIAYPQGFPWVAALLAGALLSATDPAAVIAVFEKMNLSARPGILLEGESLFNDATAIVLFAALLELTMPESPMSVSGNILMTCLHFLSVFLGGIAVGVMAGLLMRFFNRLLNDINLKLMVTVASVYFVFILAEEILGLSGVMAVLIAGLVPGVTGQHADKQAEHESMDRTFDFLATVAGALIFLLAGITITWTMFADQWLAMLIGIGSVLGARFISLFFAFPVINRLPVVMPVRLTEQFLLAWGGVRGTVTLALALSLPLSLDYWYTIQSIAYGVVLFTLFVQTTTMPPVIKVLKLDKA